jgi:hypothetical protein
MVLAPEHFSRGVFRDDGGGYLTREQYHAFKKPIGGFAGVKG